MSVCLSVCVPMYVYSKSFLPSSCISLNFLGACLADFFSCIFQGVFFSNMVSRLKSNVFKHMFIVLATCIYSWTRLFFFWLLRSNKWHDANICSLNFICTYIEYIVHSFASLSLQIMNIYLYKNDKIALPNYFSINRNVCVHKYQINVN